MNADNSSYTVGDWMVHAHYGVGQVRRLEEMPLDGAERLCYRVRTEDGVFWLPTDNADNERVRPLASPRRIQRALEVLQNAPKKMASKFQARYRRIQEDSLDGDLTTDLRLLRDLNFRQHKKGLSTTEQQAFEAVLKRVVKEWSLSKGIERQEARQKLKRSLRENWNRVKESQDQPAA